METKRFYNILLNKSVMTPEDTNKFIDKFEFLYNNDEEFEVFLIDNDLYSYYSSIIKYIESK